MPRVKRGTGHVKHRRNILAQAKGFMWGRKSLIKLAKTAITKAGAYRYRDRRNKKREFKRLWNVRINAGLFDSELSYSKFVGNLRKKNVQLDRKTLSTLAMNHPEVFNAVAEQAK